jgi:hypothetical protein
MSAIVFKVDKRNGDYVAAVIAPMNRAEDVRFGLVDLLLTAFLLACAGGLVWLMLAG